jgi:acetolactate synthase-1/2/3 large subunit
MNAWEAILHMIKAQGTDYIFGLGDIALQLYAEKVPGIHSVRVRYEGSAPFMAMAYARLTGKPGVCGASAGPGTANLVPGVLEAYSGCVPLVVICQSISRKTEGMADFQETDQLGMMRPITKWSARVPYAERLPWFIHRAFSIAMNGQPGPVYLEVPYDVSGVSKYELVDVIVPDYVPAKKIRCAADPELVSDAVELLLKAKRPVAIVGNGAVWSGASEEIKELVELLGMPFITTPGGRGILPETHPLALGVCGLYRTKVGKAFYSDADLLFSIGSRNEAFQTHSWKDFPKGARFIQLDIAPFEIGRNWMPDIGIMGDVKLSLQQINELLKGFRKGRKHYTDLPRVKELMSAKEAFEREVAMECRAEAKPILAKRAVHELSETFSENTVLVNENGAQDSWSYCFPYYTVKEGSVCVPVAEETCMGMGVVGAIAAKLVAPDKKVVCVTGDGAFQMYMKELPTAVQYKVGCTWMVLNNSALGWVKHNQRENAGWDSTTFLAQPDFIKWAEACQCYGRRVENAAEIKPALEEALGMNKKGIPAVIDIAVGLDMSHFKGAE